MTEQGDARPRGTTRSRHTRLHASPSVARWGLLLTTIVTAAALLGTGLSAYAHARSTAAAVTRSLAIGMFFSARQAIVAAGSADHESLEAVLAAMEAQGVRYLAIMDEGAEAPRVFAGASQASSELLRPEPLAEGAVLRAARGGSWVWLSGPLVPPPPGGRGWMSRRMGGPMAGQTRGPMGGAMGGPFGRGMRFGPERLVLEFESVTANQTVAQAIVTVSLSCAATIVLLAAALFFWRLSRRAEQSAAQSEQDRRLKALGEMSAVLGHELRNPIAALKGHAQLLLEKLPQEHPGRRSAETVVREAVRLEDLATNVLDFVRSGKVEQETVDPVAIARAAVEANGGGTRLDVSGPIPAWRLDGARIEAVLANLLRNARQSSPTGAGIELALAAPGGQELVFEVRDHGAGIDSEGQRRIFEPFFTTRARGTGLGLAVAKQIVESHGGRITAGNHPEGGALFRVVLPRTPPGAARSRGE